MCVEFTHNCRLLGLSLLLALANFAHMVAAALGLLLHRASQTIGRDPFWGRNLNYEM